MNLSRLPKTSAGIQMFSPGLSCGECDLLRTEIHRRCHGALRLATRCAEAGLRLVTCRLLLAGDVLRGGIFLPGERSGAT
eukprot:1321325-Pyramimonas_sp.AAC.1